MIKLCTNCEERKKEFGCMILSAIGSNYAFKTYFGCNKWIKEIKIITDVKECGNCHYFDDNNFCNHHLSKDDCGDREPYTICNIDSFKLRESL